MTLEHGRAPTVELVLDRGYDPGVIVPDVVHAVPGQEVQYPPTALGEELRALAPRVLRNHLEQLEHPNPLWVHVSRVERIESRRR